MSPRKTTPRNRAAQDATLINTRATRKQIAELKRRLDLLERTASVLERLLLKLDMSEAAVEEARAIGMKG